MKNSSKLKILSAAAALSLVALSGCKQKSEAPIPGAEVATPKTDWNEFLQHFEDRYFALNPTAGSYQGLHQYDGMFPDWSADGIKQQVTWLKQVQADANAIPDDALTAPQQFEKKYLLAQVDKELFWDDDAASPFNNPSFYGLDPSVMLTRPYAPLPERMKAFIKYLGNLPTAVEQIETNLHSPMPRSFAELGLATAKGYAEFFHNDVPPIFAEVQDAALQAQLTQGLTQAEKTMNDLAAWFETEVGKSNDQFALGPERFSRMLWATERVNTPLDQLEAIGKADLERNLAALKQACAQFAPDASIVDCISKMNSDKPADGPVAEAREQLTELRQFVVDHHIVTIPSDQLAQVEEAPPYQRWNSAYIDVPGPYDKGMPSVYYIAPPDPNWSKAEQEAYIPGKADLLFTSVHEVWPGHFLQFLDSNRSPSKFGQLFVGYAFAEGWAHYAEEMMWDQGLDDGAPEIHIGQLTNALLRDVRFLCAIGMHTQGMSVATCETMFRDQAYQDPGNARQQAARGTYDPAYLNYTMGKLMIMKLRSDWLAENPGKSLQNFHDQFLSYGGPPIPLVRQAMLKKDDGKLF